MIKHNPFLSTTFKTIWLKHFNKAGNEVRDFNFIEGPSFIKHSMLPLYYNLGKTHTKGISYSTANKFNNTLIKKPLLIYDVPTYFNIDTYLNLDQVEYCKSKQYPGYLIEVEKFESLNDYMLSHFSKNSRNKNNKYKRRLETSFNINYKMHIGDISKPEYDFIFSEFRRLLEKRFTDKQVSNNNLHEKEWNFYYDIAYPLILEKKAALFVVYDNDKPIGVTLCYLSHSILFDAITVFDIDYFKFHLGSVTIMKLIEWCIENEIKTFDFSKGHFEYKTRWCTQSYNFEYHIYYNKSSVKSKYFAIALKHFYDFKQKLRENNINNKLHRFTYKFKNKKTTNHKQIGYTFTEDFEENIQDCSEINLKAEENNTLRLMIFEFLYLYEEEYNKVKLFSFNEHTNQYLIKGKTKSMLATIETK